MRELLSDMTPTSGASRRRRGWLAGWYCRRAWDAQQGAHRGRAVMSTAVIGDSGGRQVAPALLETL